MRIIGKKKAKKKKSNENGWSNIRLILFGIIVTICFCIVVGHLIILQFVEGRKWSELAYNHQVINQILSPNRGTIYDSKGEILAQSISVDTVSLNPKKVKYSNNKEVPYEVIAEGMSNIFDITYDELMQNLNSNRSVIVVARKVETTKVDELKKWMQEKKITSGINLDEDSKRFYPYETLASSLIGFCGTDNSGQFGLEERWDDILTGTAGKVVTATDVNKKAISDEYEQYVASENGSNIYLTIDAKIQATAERHLEQTVKENTTSTGGNVIIMNPQTGDILAMASYPNYNLNSPYSIPIGYDEEAWNNIEKTERSNILLNLWKNKNVSGTYEPGSTFKLITASVGLEEGIVEMDTPNDFTCTGAYSVDPNEKPISCWRKEPHGSLSLRGALCNSCNPAFIQLGQRIGVERLYKYFRAYGLFDSVGNDIARAYNGTFHDIEKIVPTELATISFGQRFEISPLQLITAVSAICNDGVLVKPKIVKQIENTDTGSIEIVETEKIRQVISKETADNIKNMMSSVVIDGTGKRAQVKGYSIGGKSGTSEPKPGREADGYVASFIAISPIENTQIVVLVTIEGLQEYAHHQGGETAGPAASKILSEVLPYLGVPSTNTAEALDDSDEVKLRAVPNVTNLTVNEANKNLRELGFNVISNTTLDPETTLVADQVPKAGVALRENSVVCLYTSNEEVRTKVAVPDVKGMTIAEAINSLKSKNLNASIDGEKGVVVSQDPTFETEVGEGTVVNILVKADEVYSQ